VRRPPWSALPSSIGRSPCARSHGGSEVVKEANLTQCGDDVFSALGVTRAVRAFTGVDVITHVPKRHEGYGVASLPPPLGRKRGEKAHLSVFWGFHLEERPPAMAQGGVA
jgi:hypothetical protein